MREPVSLSPDEVEGLSEAEAEQVLKACVAAKDARLPLALAESRSKPHARLAKKALYQLRSVGVQVDAPRPKPAPSRPEDDEPPTDTLPAVLTAPLGTGERIFYFARPLPAGGIVLVQAVVSDEFGILKFDAVQTSRATYRNRLRELRRAAEISVMFVPLSRIVEELGRALTLNDRTSTTVTAEVADQLHRLGVEPLDPDWPVPQPLESDAAHDAESAALHDEFELGQWYPPEAELERLAVESPTTDEARATRAQSAAAEFFTAPRRALYARRLWLAAELLELTQRPAQAQVARATARRLMHGDGPSPFCVQLFAKVFELSAPKVADPLAQVLAKPLLSPPSF